MIRRSAPSWVTALVLVAILVGAAVGCQSAKTAHRSAGSDFDVSVTDPAAMVSDDELEQRVRAHAAFAAGVLHQERDESEDAYTQFARAAENDPGNEALATEVARHYLQKNQLPLALVVLERTSAEPTASGVIKTLLADTLRRSGQTNAAIAAYRDAIRTTPTLLGSYQQLAELYLERKEPAQAEAIINQALQTPSEVPLYWAGTADLFDWLGKAYPAGRPAAQTGRRIAVEKATALQPDEPGLLLRLGRARMELGDNAQAEALFQQANDRLPKDPAVAASLAEVLIREGRLKEARESLELLSRANPTSHFPWYFLGIVDLEEHREAEAVRKFERALNLNPQFEPVYGDLAVAQMSMNDLPAALATLTRARVRFPDSFRLAFLTGMVHARLKDLPAALAAFQEAEAVAARTKPDLLDHQYYFQVGATLERGGQEEEAVKYLEKSIELEPDFDEALNHLGYMWADQGKNLERAQVMIEKAVKREPDNPAYLDSLGWVFFKRGQPAEALPWLEKAIKLLPEPDATVYDHLADVLAALGRKAEAKEAWRKSLGLEKSDVIQKKLDALP